MSENKRIASEMLNNLSDTELGEIALEAMGAMSFNGRLKTERKIAEEIEESELENGPSYLSEKNEKSALLEMIESDFREFISSWFDDPTNLATLIVIEADECNPSELDIDTITRASMREFIRIIVDIN